ncbi:Carnitine O-acetyltransferase [Pteropus alecto]|uniref:Carnitine O-acetyltransferase n=1 Tax=Pteropus alecto TaxID=9402 RepID=L5K7A8_PTEAL|nr:Carnitine O-acetyltransferase [Pteropus alecto]
MLAFAARTVVKPLGFLKPSSLTKVYGRFKAHQDSLPRLPVPPLQQSLDHYLKALQPIISEEEWVQTKQLVEEFQTAGGVGERLQKGLERRAKKMENWLSEWWLKTAYLQYRQPLVIYSSPGLVLPRQDFVDLQGQLRFAAKLIEGVLDFKTMVDNETLPVEHLGGKPLCMNQYYQILSSCRVPGPKQDSVINFKTKKSPTHITVVHNYQFFELDVYHSDGTPLTSDQIFVQLEKIWNSSLQTNKEPVGILTSNHRNSWAKAYSTLIKDKVNRESVRSIQKSIFIVCLDAPMPRVSEDVYRSQVAGQMLHGGGSKLNSGNRWFDKTLQFFELDVYHSDGTPLTSDQIFVQLEKIWNSSLQTNKEPVGILTSNHRNSWAKAYSTLIKDKVNRESVRSIQKSIFIVCLDAPMPRVSEDVYRSQVAGQMLHGGGSKLNSGNRWFDKTLQFIVAEDGSCGLVYEHAAAEGPPIITLVDHVIEYTKLPELVRSPMVPLPMPKKLRFNITPEVKSDIEKAKQNLSIMIQDLDISITVFHHFGKDFPKSEKMSPDAFIQMALQLAYYRIYGHACATYESASLRMFHLGRTDTIRSASMDSLTFVKSMDDSSVAEHQKVELLRRAVQAHRSYTDRAIRGEAFDRHLLGLKLQAIEDLVSMPDIFMDTSYAIAMHFNLSTSQVPSKIDCVMSFGPVVPDGYGVCYNPMEAHINFSVSAYNSCAETNAARLTHYLEKALLDMRALLQSHPRAKL